MKAVLLRSPGKVVLNEVPVPEISDDEVLVEVKYCGICGSDVHAIADCVLYPPETYMGHEISGVLSSVGGNVEAWKVGERVVVSPIYSCGHCFACTHGRHSLCDQAVEHFIGCRPGLQHAGGFARFVRVPIPEFRLNALPDTVSYEEGALVEPLAVSLHSVRMSTFRAREKVMVLGAGMIGLGVVAHLKQAGAGLIIATETIERRAELARRFGADYVLNPRKLSNLKEEVLNLTGGRGVDIVFDCSGVYQAFRSAAGFLRRGGQMVLTGMITEESPIIPVEFTRNELALQGTMCYYSDEFPMVIELLERASLPLTDLITSKIKLSKVVEEGFDVLLTPGHQEIKMIVEPD